MKVIGMLMVVCGVVGSLNAFAADPADSAKPQACTAYIEHGEWVYRFNEWTLSLVPTACGRQITADDTPLMFYEIAKKFAGSPYWQNTRGLINQLTCHLVIARDKPEWNLDPWRPYVGYNKTVAAECNVVTPDPDPEFH